MPSKWIFAGTLIALALILALGAGYREGYNQADAKRQAEVAELHARLDGWKAAQAQAWAAAEHKAREELEAAQTRANTLAAKLTAAQKARTAKTRDITRRIPHATAGNTCAFSPEFVRLYNEAIGAAAGGGDAGHGAVSQAGNSGSAVGATGTAPAAGAGLRHRAVTSADILAHIRDYGARAQAMEAQINALIDLLNRKEAD